ncbi:unnamed protein product [Protopolystoma xenopodis]|uniref:Uncharacterized protein n=1 Tax=Protopolystoma xenopodis TaxID=117903 RepID=A0A3S5B5I0_9PLAT|nr:unnamed protein product [Protopolystoma xenopodis]
MVERAIDDLAQRAEHRQTGWEAGLVYPREHNSRCLARPEAMSSVWTVRGEGGREQVPRGHMPERAGESRLSLLLFLLLHLKTQHVSHMLLLPPHVTFVKATQGPIILPLTNPDRPEGSRNYAKGLVDRGEAPPSRFVVQTTDSRPVYTRTDDNGEGTLGISVYLRQSACFCVHMSRRSRPINGNTRRSRRLAQARGLRSSVIRRPSSRDNCRDEQSGAGESTNSSTNHLIGLQMLHHIKLGLSVVKAD